MHLSELHFRRFGNLEYGMFLVMAEACCFGSDLYIDLHDLFCLITAMVDATRVAPLSIGCSVYS